MLWGSKPKKDEQVNPTSEAPPSAKETSSNGKSVWKATQFDDTDRTKKFFKLMGMGGETKVLIFASFHVLVPLSSS